MEQITYMEKKYLKHSSIRISLSTSPYICIINKTRNFLYAYIVDIKIDTHSEIVKKFVAGFWGNIAAISFTAFDKSINRRVARSANLINNYRLEE